MLCHRVAVALMIGSLSVLAGCQEREKPKAEVHGPKEAHGHSHERDKMKIADAGKYHAALTAHLAKDGNELDIFFETQDEDNPKPVAVPLESFTVEAQTAEGAKHELKFEPAPAGERPKDEKPGTCSHFVAKAGWMKPTDNLSLVGRVTLDGKNVTMRWKDFNPKKYAHHEE